MKKIGLIGLGNMGRVHRRVLYEMRLDKEIEEVAVYDTNTDAFFQDLGKDYKDHWMLIDTMAQWADGIVIATPTPTHVDIVKQIYQVREVPLLVEKPFSLHSDEVASFGNKIMVGYVERFNPVVQWLRGSNLISYERTRIVETCRVSKQNQYRSEGIVLDLGVHDFDLIRFLFSQSLKLNFSEVIYRGAIPVAATSFYDAGHIRVRTTLSWVAREKRRSIRIVTVDDVVNCDLISHEITVLNLRTDKSWKITAKGSVEPVRAELQYFLRLPAISFHEYWSNDLLGRVAQRLVDDISIVGGEDVYKTS